MKFKEYCEIISLRLKGDILTLKLKTLHIARNSLPGQFVNVRVNENLDPLLRRPFSICDADGDVLTLMILIKGKGTELLADKKAGEFLNVIGPLGNGFPVITTGKKPIFVGGGIGAAPFLFLSKKMKDGILLYGVKNAGLLANLEAFAENCRVSVCSDDGSTGFKGTVIDLLAEYDLTKYVIYACGPVPMFHAMNKLFKSCGGIEAYYSLETFMGCGFGACKGCPVETPAGDYLLSCTNGPVFPWDGVRL